MNVIFLQKWSESHVTGTWLWSSPVTLAVLLILRLILSWKFPGKLLCITLFFTSCHWYNIVVYFTKKMPFRVPKILGKFNGKICSECISYNLEFQNFAAYQKGVKPPSRSLPHLCLWHSVRASSTQLSPYFINWDSYFNSFWEPCSKRPEKTILVY